MRELGDVELLELCETFPKVQCSHCLLYWNQGIVYCTCGQCLIDSESRRTFHKPRLDAHVIKKGRNHGARHGKTKEQTEFHMAWNAWKRCCKKVDSQGEHFTGFHYRFLRDPVYLIGNVVSNPGQNKGRCHVIPGTNFRFEHRAMQTRRLCCFCKRIQIH